MVHIFPQLQRLKLVVHLVKVNQGYYSSSLWSISERLGKSKIIFGKIYSWSAWQASCCCKSLKRFRLWATWGPVAPPPTTECWPMQGWPLGCGESDPGCHPVDFVMYPSHLGGLLTSYPGFRKKIDFSLEMATRCPKVLFLLLFFRKKYFHMIMTSLPWENREFKFSAIFDFSIFCTFRHNNRRNSAISWWIFKN